MVAASFFKNKVENVLWVTIAFKKKKKKNAF